MLTPSFSRNAFCDQLESQETPHSFVTPCVDQLAERRLVQLQLVGADRTEGERVEDQDGPLALQILLRDAATVFGGEPEARYGCARREDAHCPGTGDYLRSPSSLISAR